MKASPELVRFVARLEGFRDRAYRPLPTDRWTIGYGSTYIQGRPVGPTDVISEQVAIDLLTHEIEVFSSLIASAGLPSNLLLQQFDAVVSLVYNIGFSAFKNSITGRRFYAGHDISDRFVLFNKSGGKIIPGLTNRRLQEKEIYVNGNYAENK